MNALPARRCRAALAGALLAGASTTTLVGCAGNPPAAQPAKRPIVVQHRGSVVPPVATGKPGRPALAAVADSAPTPAEVPADVASTPDPVPIDEPKSALGNPDLYEANGQMYAPLADEPASGYFESGVATWYGNKFHGKKTASGERYDMFGMTAAHRTLRLPSYVRITNLDNGKTCVVRVNDRGPFVKNRILDLSYAAAARLDMLKAGSANISLELLAPQAGGGEMRVPDTSPRWLQAGAYASAGDVTAALGRIGQLGLTAAEIVEVPSSSGDGVDQMLRIGPFGNFAELERARLKLIRKGIRASPVLQ